MKKVICFILTLCLIMSIFVCPTYAEEVRSEENPVKHGTEVYVKGKDIIIQSHPWGWDDNDLEIIDKITKVLVSEDYAFMTPQEYYNYCKKQNQK